MEESYRYKPLRFFCVTNLIMWTPWMIAAYLSYQPGGHEGLISLLELIGLFSPLVTALWMILRSNNNELKQNFYDRLFNLKLIKPSTIPSILLIFPISVVISVYLSYLFFNQPMYQLAFNTSAPFVAGIIPVPFLLMLAPLVEEIGWKGYGVESLRGERSFFMVTFIFAALWFFWHIPTFFVNHYYQNMLLRTNLLFAINFMVSMFPAAFIINWLWYRNSGSILTAVLLHAIIDFQGMLQMGQIAKCIQTIVLIIFAIIIVSKNKKIFFEQFPSRIGYYGKETFTV